MRTSAQGIPARLVAAAAVVVVLSLACGTTQSAQRPTTCRLPVLMFDTSSSPQAPGTPKFAGGGDFSVVAGFVSIPSGQFRPDNTADVHDLPFTPTFSGQVPRPVSYDIRLHRWMPVGLDSISADGHSYMYSSVAGESWKLHVFDIDSHSDRVVLSGVGAVGGVAWSDNTIIAALAGGQTVRIDPRSGQQFPQQSPSPPPTYGPPSGAVIGHDRYGNPIETEGHAKAGTPFTVFVDLGSGQRSVIYAGSVGDPTDFRPFRPTIDGDQLWFGNEDNRYMWMWSPNSGLHRYPLFDAGPLDSTANVGPAGPCVP